MNDTQSQESRILVYGIGNPGRRDDGLGAECVARLEAAKLHHVTADANYQLNVEDALVCSQYDAVIFVDAAKNREEPFTWKEVKPTIGISFTTHELAPSSLLALVAELYGRHPKAYLLAISGYDWEIGEGLSEQAEQNLRLALDSLKKFLKKLTDPSRLYDE